MLKRWDYDNSMNPYRPISGFEREQHYKHFTRCMHLHPVGGITVRLNCTKLFRDAKEKGHSFFLRYIHAALTVLNTIPNFKYRLSDRNIEEEYMVFDTIHCSAVVGRPDHSFGFAFFEYMEDYAAFEANARTKMDAIKHDKNLVSEDRKDLIYTTVVKDIDFTALKFTPSPAMDIPHLGFGKVVEKDGQLEMSMAIQYLHAFQDGYHIGQFINKMQAVMDKSSITN